MREVSQTELCREAGLRAERRVERPSRCVVEEKAQRFASDQRCARLARRIAPPRGLHVVGWKRISSGLKKKRNPRCRYPFSLDQQRALVLRRPAPVVRFRAFQDPLRGCVPPLASLRASRRNAVPMQSFVRSNSGSGLAANRRNRITPRAPILPLTEFLVFLNRRSTKDPHPPSSHSPVGVAGDFWLGSRFRSPTGSTKNCQRTRVVLLLRRKQSTEKCDAVSRRTFSQIARIAHCPARFLCTPGSRFPAEFAAIANLCGTERDRGAACRADERGFNCEKPVANRLGSGFPILSPRRGSRAGCAWRGSTHLRRFRGNTLRALILRSHRVVSPAPPAKKTASRGYKKCRRA